uniref:Ring finger protein 17 n=1 Tax=Astyanax mexicanus TaxID=7994 RepID=W5KUQ3_ASTMX
MSDSAVTCNNCGLPYTLPDEVVGNVPHVLLCGHIFCTVCLLESPRGFITCHECKMVTNVGEEGVDGLQVDSRIIGLIYTARMNTKKQGDKLRARKFRSPSASPPARTEHPNTEVGPDMLKVLDEALCKATENLNTLDNLHQTLTSGIHAQLKKERSRITKEIEDCTEKAIGMLHKRSVLMSELSSLEQLFSDGREECQKLEERRKEMRMAIQKAKHVRQVPSLGTYCHLDKVLETLETPVDVGSYDMSSLTLCSKLCVLHVDILTESLSKFLYLMDGDVKWVVLTHVVNPTHFYVRLVSEHKAGVALTKKVNKLCFEEHRRFMDKDEIKTMLVFVRWKEDWCRAKVCELFQKGCLECVTQCCAAEIARLQVFFQDHGFTKGLTFSEGGLRGLNECLRKVDSDAQFELHHWAPQAIRCSLRDIIPSDLVKGWSAEARDEMRRVIGSGAVEMQVFSEDRDTLLVDLKKASVDDILLSLREHLVFMELAFYSPQVAPSGSKPLQFYPPVHPKLNLELHAVVSYVNTPSDFYVQLQVDSMEFLLLNSKLQDCYGPPGSATELQIYCPCLGQACVALCEKNKDWCRAEVTFPGGRMVEVQYVDFGNKKTVSINDLRQIKDEFFALPAMLVPHSKVLPVRLYEVSKCFTEPAVSIGEILVKRGLASLVTKVQLKETPLPDTAVWDPPLSEEHKSPDEPLPPPPPPTVEPPELQVTLNLPACLKDLRVRVTHVTSPGHICVQLLQFDNQLKGYLKSDQQEVDWKVEMSCAANVNGVWERGKVCSVSTSNISEVLRCDFGNTVKLHISNLRPLLPELVGSLLLECCLSDIPAGGRSTWTATACDFISYYLTGATAVMTIKDASARPAPVSLFCSNRSGQDVSIADFLISEGLALRERTVSPRPAPLTTPSPEKVKTQAYLPPEFPPCGHTRMSISAVSDDGVIYAMTPQACEFERLKDCLQQHIKTLPRQRHYNWKSVLGCAVMGSDMLWYRGQVQEVIGGHVKVQYVDQGIVENIPVCHVYPVVLCENIPQLSVPCQLNGVIPWQWDAVALMKELLLGRSVSVQIMELPENLHGLVTVEIILDGMALSRIMVNHQHASFDPSISVPEDYVVKPPVPDLDDWDLNTKGLEELQPVLGVFTNPTLPDKGKQFRVKVKHLRTPNEVFLSLVDMPMCDQKQETLQEALEQVNKDIDSLPQLTDFPMGPCLAEYSDGLYYRAKLLGFTELNPSIKILVRHVDYGSDDILPPCLRCLPPSLLQFPCEAVCVRLAGFKPPHVCVEVERISYRPEWSMKSMLEMIDLLHGNLSAVGVEPQLTVVLYRADKTLVHVPLVEKGLADYE